MSKGYLFSSESVTEGHPDKLADQISDAVLDAMLAKDPNSRVACETLVTTGVVFVCGEITTEGYVDIPSVVRVRMRRGRRAYAVADRLGPPSRPAPVRRPQGRHRSVPAPRRQESGLG